MATQERATQQPLMQSTQNRFDGGRVRRARPLFLLLQAIQASGGCQQRAREIGIGMPLSHTKWRPRQYSKLKNSELSTDVIQIVVRFNRYFSTRTNGRLKWESGGRWASKSVENPECAVPILLCVKVLRRRSEVRRSQSAPLDWRIWENAGLLRNESKQKLCEKIYNTFRTLTAMLNSLPHIVFNFFLYL